MMLLLRIMRSSKRRSAGAGCPNDALDEISYAELLSICLVHQRARILKNIFEDHGLLAMRSPAAIACVVLLP